MAPSPEPGQPKAPDKTSSSSSSSSSSSVTASVSATSLTTHSSSYGVSHINENSTSTTLAASTSSTSLLSSSTLNNNNSNNSSSSNNCNNNSSNNCYHQYTTSTSMTNTTTTQAHSGTLVSPGTIGSTTTNTSISLSSSSSSLASTIAAASAATTTQHSINPSSNLNTANSAIVTNSNAERTNNKNVEDWNEMGENQLKELLDEAYSYKNPKDRENKSEMFLQLLQKAEREKEENSFPFRSITARYTRGSNNHHKHGGSLQDLVEAAQNDSLLDSDYGSYGTRTRRHHHNSRPKKYSLVSSRQREGGSLPSNVNVSNCNLSVYEQPFLNEVVINKRRGKTERTCSGTSCTSGTSGTSSTVSTCGYESLSSSSTTSQTNNKDDSLSSSSLSHFTIAASGDTIIDMGGDNFLDHDVQRHLAHDSLAQGISEPLEYESGIELSVMSKKIPRNPMNAINHAKLETMCSESRSWVDEQITFSPLERSGKCVDSSCLPLNESHKCCKSLLDNDKSDTIKSPSSSSIFAQNKMSSTSKQFDENGNALNSTASYSNSSTTTTPASISNQSQAKSSKKRKSQFDKNSTTWDAQCVEGYRGEDTVEELVKFIESTNNSDSKKNDKNIKQESKRKEKKKDKDKDKDKEEKKKIKRSNSLEELRSCTKLDEDEKTESHVTMRSKGGNKKNNNEKIIGINNNTTDGKENIKQQQQQVNHNKRGERRSWGTEELSYLGESNAIEEVREKVKEKEKSKKSKDLKDSKDVKDIKDNKEIKDREMVIEKHGKLEKAEKMEKSEKTEKLEKQEKTERFEKVDKSEGSKLEKNEHSRKKKDEHYLSVVSMESVSNESAEFHVVTKRKKAKKRQTLDTPLNSKSGNTNVMSTTSRSGDNNSYMSNSKRYQASSHFTNDREVYLNSLNANESRRKSTSSVPPSEKSDSSDLDSVHSLPIGSSSSSRHIGHSSKNVTIAAAASSNVPLSSSLGQTHPQSYADIARIVNLNKTSTAMMSSPSSTDKIDKWPVVQQTHSINITANANENSIASNVCANKSASSATGNSNTKKITQNKDFPDLISDKTNNQNNDAGSSCSSTSSTSTIVKQVTYSQSLGDEKHINDMTATTTNTTTGNKSGTGSSSKSSKLIDVFKNNNNDGTTVSSSNGGNKQTLQKSKSIDIDAYCNFDQYPALEKTIKKHSQQNNSNLITVTNLINTGTSKQRSISINQLSTVGGGGGGHFNQSSNNSQSSNIVVMASQQQQQSSTSSSLSSLNPSDNKSKLVNHILDTNMNTNSNLISTSSSPNNNNLSNNNSNVNSMINGSVNMINAIISSGGGVTSNNGKKSHKQQQQINNNNNMKITNVESINTMPSSIQHHQNQQLVEINNAKNKQIINQNMSNIEMLNTANVNKKTKSDTLQSSGAHNRKTKRDKNNQNNSSSGNNNSGNISGSIVDLQQFPPLVSPSSLNSNNNNNNNNSISNSNSNNNNNNSNGGNNGSNNTSNKHSNRPAVIILNDIINDNSLSVVNDFTFGDFNEEELRLFENHIPLSDSDQFNVTSSSTSYQDMTNEDALCTTHLSSLHDSDHGYSSSTNNRSVLSESNDGCSGGGVGGVTTTATQSQTDQNLIQGTTTMNIVVVDPSAIKIDTKQNLQQCTTISPQGVSSSSSGAGPEAYYMEKIFSVSPNCMKTQAQTIYYQQQPQSQLSSSAQQQHRHHSHPHQQHQTTTILTTNLGTNVVAVVPITGDSSSSGVIAAGGAGNIAPINNNIQNNSTNISCSSNSDLNLNSYQNVDTKVIEIVNCNCGKFNTDNVKQITTTIVSASDIVRSKSNNNSSIGGEMTGATSGGSSVSGDNNIVTVNLNNSNNNVDKINNNIVINNHNNEVINSQQQQQQEISSSTAVDNSSNIRINSSDSSSSSKNEQKLGYISKTISSSTTTMTTTSPSSLINKTLSSDVVAVTVAVALDTKNKKTGATCATPSVGINEISTTNNASNINTNNNSNNNNWDNNRKKTTIAAKTKEINVRFIPPSIAHELNSINYEKIVDFVGLAWQEISGTNRGVQFYNGQ